MTPLLVLAATLTGPALPATITVRTSRTPWAAAAPVPDRQLALMRGGLRLPNGLDLSLGIDIQTRIDGMLALHTVYASEGPAAGIRVYTDGAKPVALAPTNASITSGAVPSIPLLMVDRSPTGTTIVPTSATAENTVNLVRGDPSTWLSGEGQVQIPVTPNGPPVNAAPGSVALTTDTAGSTVTLSTPTAEIRQLVGQATGVVIFNTANDRMIDTVSSINVDLRGFAASTLAGTFLAQRAALETLITR